MFNEILKEEKYIKYFVGRFRRVNSKTVKSSASISSFISGINDSQASFGKRQQRTSTQSKFSKTTNNTNNNTTSSNNTPNTSEDANFEAYFKTNYPWQSVYLSENVEKELEEVIF